MSRTSVLAALLLFAPLSFACKKETAPPPQTPGQDSVDQLTREFLEALADGEREHAQLLSNQLLATELDARTVVTIGRNLVWLGPHVSLTRVDEKLLINGVERRYRVGFDHGEVTLTITVVGGKVEGFEFDEGQWDAINERASEAAAGSLRVAQFDFVGPDGKPVPTPLDPAKINYNLVIEGLEAELREHHVVIVKHVFDKDGHVIYRQDDDDDIRFPQAESGSVGGAITGSVAVPGPGTYHFELKIIDAVGDKSMMHHVPFTIP
jgi:hypothetical protein